MIPGVIWILIISSIIIIYLPIKKMGTDFLIDVHQLPLLIQMQKHLFMLIQMVLITVFWLLISIIVIAFILATVWLKDSTVITTMISSSLVGIIIGIVLGLVLGKLLQQLIAKYIEPFYSNIIKNKKNYAIEGQSDVRDVFLSIQNTHDYEPIKYFSEKSVFIGLDEHKKPIYVSINEFKKTHFQIMGCTGSGKSVAAIDILVQALKQGMSTVMFDPKVGADEWAPHVLKEMCQQYGKEFVIIDLQHQKPQINLLQDISEHELNELLQSGMGIEDKGGDGDYYRLKDRKAARQAASLATKATSFSHLYHLMIKERPAFMEAADSFSDKLEMLSTIPAVQTATGINIRQLIEEGACLYIVGAMREPQVKMLQKMVLLRIMQIIERRDRLDQHNHVVMFIDELKYYLTRPVLDALSTVRDHGCNLLLGHQAPGDLLDVSKDLSGQACQNAVITNTNIKLIYKLNEERDQRWAATLTGEKTVMRQSMRQRTNMGVGEITNTDERQLMGVQESLYSHNYFAQLRPRVGIVIGLGLAKLCFTSPIKVKKTPLVFPSFRKEKDYIQALFEGADVSKLTKKPAKRRIVMDEKIPQKEQRTVDNADPFNELSTMNELENHDLGDIK